MPDHDDGLVTARDEITICIRADRGVPPSVLAAVGKAIEKARPGAVLDTTATCCNFHFRGER